MVLRPGPSLEYTTLVKRKQNRKVNKNWNKQQNGEKEEGPERKWKGNQIGNGKEGKMEWEPKKKGTTG